MDIDKTTRLLSEGLARSVDRRSFLKRTGGAIFATVATLASGHVLGNRAGAAPTPPTKPVAPPERNPPPGTINGDIRCNPPNATYCNRGSGDLSGCHGGQCNTHAVAGNLYTCVRDYTYYPGTGCWTTASGNGYWTCCDCKCTRPGSVPSVCGCAQYSSRTSPGVDGANT